MSETTGHTKSPSNIKSAVVRVILYLMVPVGFILLYVFSSGTPVPKKTNWHDLEINMISQKAIEKIEIVNNEKALIYIKKEFADMTPFKEIMKASNGKKVLEGPHYSISIGSVESFERKLLVSTQKQKNMNISWRVE